MNHQIMLAVMRPSSFWMPPLIRNTMHMARGRANSSWFRGSDDRMRVIDEHLLTSFIGDEYGYMISSRFSSHTRSYG